MSLNKTYFEPKKKYEPLPVPTDPGYVPPSPPTPPSPDPGSVPVISPPSFSGSTSIQFYINSSDEDTLDKNITASGSAVNVVIKDRIDLLDFEIPFDSTSITGINYASMLGRYYFCKPVLDKGNITGLHFTVDALMTYKDQIRNLSAIVDRTGSNFNTYLTDPEVRVTAYNNIHRVESSSGFGSTLYYYLLTVGGSGGI